MSTADLDTWAASVDGVSLDMDYAFPQECHDVFLSRLVSLGGTISDGHAPGVGYTNAVWHGFPNYRPGLAKLFTRHGPETILRGDIVFWDSYAGVGGLPHVAVALADAPPGSVYAMTQNPGVARRATLTRTGVVGVLRPISITTAAAATTQTEEDDDMPKNQACWTRKKGKQINRVFNAVSGFDHEWESKNGEYNTNILKTFDATGTVNSEVSVSQYDALTSDLANVRAGRA